MIRNKRKEKNLTQQELGNALSVSSQMIAQYENDKRKPKIDTLRKICTAMGITIGDLGPDIWKCYSAEDFAEDLLDSTLSKLPKQIESAIKNNAEEDMTKLRFAGEQAQQHSHEIVDSNWKSVVLLSHFEKLNADGQTEAVKRVSELTEIKKYTEKEDK